MTHDWRAWHEAYDHRGSPLARRLAVVQQCIAAALDAAPAGPIRVVSMCAGQGRDLLGVLPDHPRRADMAGRRVEVDPRTVDVARRQAREQGVDGIEVVAGDASAT